MLSSPAPSKQFFSYGFALGASVLAGLLTKSVGPAIGPNFFEIFQAAVVLSAWFGGRGPGLVAAGVSFLILDYFFLPPINAFALGPSDLFRMVLFGAVALLTSSLNGKLKESKSELELAHQELEIRIEKRTQQLSQANKNLTAEVAHRMSAEKALLEISNREQRRFGQDLHDGLCQLLAGLKLMAENLKDRFGAKSLEEAEDMEQMESRLTEALAQADILARGLYPVELETNGLMAALDELVDKTSQLHRVKCRFMCGKPVEIRDGACATHLYRIAQECVVNAIKSGKASRINIHLIRCGARVVLSVADNGVGLKNSVLRGGMGIKMMEYRARVLGADLLFQSRNRGGTRVCCSLNLPEPDESYRNQGITPS